ncbi:lysylphosphatidylglycerol synthase transmembrane domain-containing protein [Fictibacillus sp. NPDC058756]|uniref:lysylphosphatidylglycerol synthase transmembrane domain-containing protein n=1 Tax=Fictibacillus sp. NPDC058756 TaxID=3346625 RepID=UPI0036AD4B48
MKGFKTIRIAAAVSLIALFVWLSIRYFSYSLFLEGLTNLIRSPFLLLFMFFGYLSAFFLRALGWQMYLSKNINFRHYLYGLFYSLLVNHLLPVKAGDLMRIGYLSSIKTDTGKTEIMESVVVMRIFDLIVLGAAAIGFGSFIGISLAPDYFYVFVVIIFTGILLLYLLRKKIPFLDRISKNLFCILLSARSIVILLVISLSWILEAAVVYGTLLSFSETAGVWESIWVNSITIAGQVFHFTPGGAGTYEATMSSALIAAGITPAVALQAAIISHLFKFVFSYLAGAFTIVRAPISFKELWLSLKQKKEVNQT